MQHGPGVEQEYCKTTQQDSEGASTIWILYETRYEWLIRGDCHCIVDHVVWLKFEKLDEVLIIPGARNICIDI